MNVLLSFVGNRDPFVDGEPGPVLSLLEAHEYNRIYLFCTGDDYFERAKHLAEVAAERLDVHGIYFVSLELESVIDYEEIYAKLQAQVDGILTGIEHTRPDISVLLDPGTPQMQTSWFLLVRSGRLRAHLLQGVPPRFAGGIYKVKKVDLGETSLPRLSADRGSEIAEAPAAGESNWITQSGVPLVGESPAFREVLARAAQIAPYDLSVLLQGETGSGKGVVARYIHDNSRRRGGPFQSINCSTIPGSLAESELFGTVKGAFTGAEANRPGRLRAADGGTVFLDEIGDLPLEIQPKLLEVLETQSITPVGSDTSKTIDVRIVAATNRDLRTMVENKEFRHDLYQRLGQVPLEVPPLRERREDIPLLVRRFVEEFNQRYHEEKGLAEETIDYFSRYTWPGNIRELRNTVLNMCAIGRSSRIGPELMPHPMAKYFEREDSRPELPVTIPPEGVDLKALLHRIEKEYYEKALELAGGNLSHAAELLSINPPAFRKAWRERFAPDAGEA